MINTAKSLTSSLRRQNKFSHVAAGSSTSAVPEQSCAVNLVPVSTAQRRRRRLEKSSCLSSLIIEQRRLRGTARTSIQPSVAWVKLNTNTYIRSSGLPVGSHGIVGWRAQNSGHRLRHIGLHRVAWLQV